MLIPKIVVAFLIILGGYLNPVLSSHVFEYSDNFFIRSAKAVEILKYMNQSVNPCDNFYDFVCGNWPTVHPATMEEIQNGYVFTITEDYESHIAAMLEKIDPFDDESLRKAKNFYRSCMNLSTDKGVYGKKLLEIVSEFGKMPVLEEEGRWQAKDFDWLKIIAEIAYKYDIRIILGFTITKDIIQNNVKLLQLRHFEFPLRSVEMYTRASHHKYRLKYWQEIAADLREFLGVNDLLADQTADDILKFEAELVAGVEKDLVTQGELQEFTTLDDIQEKYAGKLDVQRLLKISLGALPQWIVSERTPSYQEHLINILENVDKEVLANYIFYNLLRPFMVAARKPKRTLQHKCIFNTRNQFYSLVENTMYRKFNISQAELAVRNMFADFKAIFHSGLSMQKYNWMSPAVRSHAVEKLQIMTIQIDSYDNDDFSLGYAKVNTTPQDYIGNLRSVFMRNANRTRAAIYAPLESYPRVGIALAPSFVRSENRIHIPVVTLLPPYLWSASYPNAINLAQLGFLIAHEIMHGFDDGGRLFDKQGNVRDWWDSSSEVNFEKLTQCFVNQYKEYIFRGTPLLKRELQSENIADNGGLRLAYETYMTWYQSSWGPRSTSNEEYLPSFDYTGPQLFFISFAQQWCSDIHPYYVDQITATDTHTPPEFRVIGSLANMEEFSATFMCPRRSGMNPEKKCRIY